jgi:hypothetical protein
MGRNGRIDLSRFAEPGCICNSHWLSGYGNWNSLGGDILMRLQYAFFRVMSRIEAKRCFDESGLATGAGWIITETLSYLGGLVLARRYRRNVGAGSAGN